MSTPAPVSVDQVMSDLQASVRERVRRELVRHGASDALNDPALFAEIDRLLREAVSRSHPSSLLLPEILGDPSFWRVDTAMRFSSHRSGVGGLFIFVKERMLMPVFRWLFEYSRDNFERQRRVNEVLFACVQELALENARLKREVERIAAK